MIVKTGSSWTIKEHKRTKIGKRDDLIHFNFSDSFELGSDWTGSPKAMKEMANRPVKISGYFSIMEESLDEIIQTGSIDYSLLVFVTEGLRGNWNPDEVVQTDFNFFQITCDHPWFKAESQGLTRTEATKITPYQTQGRFSAAWYKATITRRMAVETSRWSSPAVALVPPSVESYIMHGYHMGVPQAWWELIPQLDHGQPLIATIPMCAYLQLSEHSWQHVRLHSLFS